MGLPVLDWGGQMQKVTQHQIIVQQIYLKSQAFGALLLQEGGSPPSSQVQLGMSTK